MKKLILRWVGLALFLCLVALACVRLGEWQLDRLDQKREANAVAKANELVAPVPHDELMGSAVEQDVQWRRVSMTGEYTGEQYQVRYRSQADSQGIEVAAVFQTTEGDELLVDRGFIPRVSGQPDTEILPDLPQGVVSIVGFLHRDEQGRSVAVTPHEFKVRLINSEAIGESLGRDLLPGYVILAESTPADGGGMQLVTSPDLNEGNHFSYALQWFAFGIIAVVGIAVLIRADLKDRRKERERAGRGDQKRVDATV